MPVYAKREKAFRVFERKERGGEGKLRRMGNCLGWMARTRDIAGRSRYHVGLFGILL